MLEWKIPKKTDKCCSCQSEFEHNQQILSAILYRENQFIRKDFCLKCADDKKQGFFAYWLTKIDKSKPKLNLEGLKEFFKKAICEQDDPEIKKIVYLISMLLIQKKLLKYVDTVIQDGQKVMILEQQWDANIVRIQEQEIPENELNLLENKIKKLFY